MIGRLEVHFHDGILMMAAALVALPTTCILDQKQATSTQQKH